MVLVPSKEGTFLILRTMCRLVNALLDRHEGTETRINARIQLMSDTVVAQLTALQAQSHQMMTELGHARDRDAVSHAAMNDIQAKLDAALAAAQASPADTSAIEALIRDIAATVTDATSQLTQLDAAASGAPGTAPVVPAPVNPPVDAPVADAPVAETPVPAVPAADVPEDQPEEDKPA